MARPIGDKCNTLYFKHECLEGGDQDETFDELTVRELTVTECAHVETLEVDTITGEGGCEDPDLPNLSFFVNASATIGDDKTLFVQTIQEVNGPDVDPPDGTGIAVIGDLRHGGLGETFYVKKVRDLDDVADPVDLRVLGVHTIDENINNEGIIVVGSFTQFYNSIRFGDPAGANFAYDRTDALNVTFNAQDGTAGVPPLNLGTVRFHRYGARTESPMVTVIFGNAFVIMANAPFNYYNTGVVIPLGYRPTTDFTHVISTYRDGNVLIRYQGHLVFKANGTIEFYNEGDDQGVAEGWFGTDNTKNCGIRAGSCSYEAVPS